MKASLMDEVDKYNGVIQAITLVDELYQVRWREFLHHGELGIGTINSQFPCRTIPMQPDMILEIMFNPQLG